MATSEKASQSRKRESEMDLSLAESSCFSVQDKLVDSVISTSSVAPVYDKTAPCDTALRSVPEESAFQALSDGPWAKRPRLNLSEDSCAKANDFSFLTFPKKLWKIVESDQFKSIWWNDDGNCVVIDEESFKKEVLERRGPLRIFETDCMKSFIRQLNLYGFSKMRQDFQRSASLAEFLAEEKAASAFSKLQFYYNPNFKRGYPHLLGRCKRRVGVKTKQPVAFSLNQDFNENHRGSEGRSPHVQSTFGLAPAEEPDLFTAAPREKAPRPPAPRKAAVIKGLAKAPSRIKSGFTASQAASLSLSEPPAAADGDELTQLAPFLLAQQGGHAEGGHAEGDEQDPDTAAPPSSASLYHLIPPVPNSPFRPVMGLPAFPSMYPDILAMQAHWASLLPFCNPWFTMPMIAAAAALSMSRSSHHHNPTYHHCPTCNCPSRSAPASNGVEPQADEYTGDHR